MLHLPDGGPWDRIELTAVTESMGRLEPFLAGLAGRLAPGGTLLVDVENEAAVPVMRRLIEGRPGAMDPAGSLADPERPLALRRALQALAAAGLHVGDVYRVPGDTAGLGPEATHAFFDAGFLPLSWMPEPPPWRYWLVARRERVLAGSVVVFGTDDAAGRRTVDGLQAFLPDDWETVTAFGGDETTAVNGAVPGTRGQVLWFLRAGTAVDASVFEALCSRVVLGPALPADDEGNPRCPGNLSGVMVPRTDLLRSGPLDAHWSETAIAAEEWLVRLETVGSPLQGVPVAFSTPPPVTRDQDEYTRQAREMLACWGPVLPKEGEETPPVPAGGEPPPAPWAGRTPRLSLCMIARDEEDFLGECLEAAHRFVDEIVVVDTGSRDRTREIAASYGARVVEQEWTDDFAAARNRGLAEVTGDWVLVLDADEVLDEAAGRRIRELVQATGVSGYHLRFTNVYTGGKTQGVLMVRLFRNLEGIRWVNRIHEQITPSLIEVGEPQGLKLSIAEVEVVHRGYTQELIESRDKNTRNERLFRMQLEECPGDIYSLYKYGDFLRRLPGRDRDARETLERCLERILEEPPLAPRGIPYAGEVGALCALEHAREGNYTRAEEILDLAFRRFMPTPNLHYIAASIALHRDRPDEAIAHYRRCLMYRDRTLVVPIQEGITSHVSIAGIAQALLRKGETAGARRLLEQAIRLQPHYDVSHMALSRLHLENGNPGQALQVLTEYLGVNPDSVGACQQATLILKSLGYVDHARRMGERAVALCERSALTHEAEEMKRVLAVM